MESLDNKVAIVTGASKGIGKGIAVALAEAGCKVILAARDADKMTKVVAEILRPGGSAQAVDHRCYQ